MKTGIKLMLLGLAVLPSTMFAQEMKMKCSTVEEPVCAKVEVQCIKAPCDPVYETFTNSCIMNNARAEFVYTGSCTDAATAKYKLENPGTEVIDRYFSNKGVADDASKIKIMTTLHTMIEKVKEVSRFTAEGLEKINKISHMLETRIAVLTDRYNKRDIKF